MEDKNQQYHVSQMKMRNLVNGVYDMQKLRIATGNRLAASLRPDLVASTDESSAEGDAQSVKVLAIASAEYERITDYYISEMQSKGRIQRCIDRLGDELTVIKTNVDYDLVSTYRGLLTLEEQQLKIVAREVKALPIWEAFFANVKGCGPLMAAVCVAYLDVYKARHASAFWKYAGLDVVYDENKDCMVGRSRSQTEMRDYVDSEGNIKQKRSLTFNPFLKTKLVGVLGGSFLKASGSTYGQVYYDYKNRLVNRADDSLTPAHIHRMATRYAVKMFLRDLWIEWRTLEGLPVSDPYEVAYLGKRPHKDPNLTDAVSAMELGE